METIELLITDMNQQGQGVGRLAGQVVFVDGAIPGDIVRVSRLIQHGSYAVGELSAIETPSSDRVQPFCPLAGCCGGCSLQPMRYEAQLAHKRRQVCELLTRLGQVGDADLRVVPVLGMENPFRYRCKIQLPVRGTAEQPQIGFFARRSHEVVDGDCCAVSHPAGDVVRRCVREYIKRFQIQPYDEVRHQGSLRHLVVRVARRTGQVLVVLVSREQKLPGTAWLKDCLAEKLAELPVWPDDRLFSGQTVFAGYTLGSLVLNYQPERTNVILGASQTVLSGPGSIEEHLMGFTFRISPQSFFQVNPAQAEVLYAKAVELAGLTRQDLALDLYCGTGTIALALARQAGRVIGVESVPAAVADAKVNAARHGLTHVEFVLARAEEWLPEFVAATPVPPAAAVIDPPRRGCDPSLLTVLRHISLRRLVYISCNPATLARDIRLLSPAYTVRTVVPVDLFPWTDAIECICLLERCEL